MFDRWRRKPLTDERSIEMAVAEKMDPTRIFVPTNGKDVTSITKPEKPTKPTVKPVCDLNEQAWVEHMQAREQWVHIRQLFVRRDSYQRDAADRTRRAISSSFDFEQFDRPWIVDNGDGTYDVTDGGGRVAGLLKKGYDGRVPCNVLPPRTLQATAKVFLNQNENNVNLSAYQKYKAALAAGEGWAVDIDAVLSAHGLEMLSGKNSSKPNGINCPQALRHIWSLGKKKAVQDVVSFLYTAFGGDRRVFTAYHTRAVYSLLNEISKSDVLKLGRLEKVMAGSTYDRFQLEVVYAMRRAQGMIAEQEAIQAAMKARYNINLSVKWQ